MEGFERFGDAILFDQPAGRFWAKVDLTADNEGEDHGGAKHKAPVQVVAETEEGDPHNIAEHDTEGCAVEMSAFIRANGGNS